jgi:hypothetical protein
VGAGLTALDWRIAVNIGKLPELLQAMRLGISRWQRNHQNQQQAQDRHSNDRLPRYAGLDAAVSSTALEHCLPNTFLRRRRIS